VGREVRGVPEAAALGGPPSIGEYLRGQRLLRGIGLDELAAVTRIPRRSIERLEAGDFDTQPDGFARGFVRAVATALGLDPDDAVSRMLVEPKAEARPESAGLPLGRLALLLAGAALLLLLVGVVWLALASRSDEPAEPTAPPLMRRDAVRSLADDVVPEATPPPAPGGTPDAD
jgi:cytoskeletal protein RodZ